MDNVSSSSLLCYKKRQKFNPSFSSMEASPTYQKPSAPRPGDIQINDSASEQLISSFIYNISNLSNRSKPKPYYKHVEVPKPDCENQDIKNEPYKWSLNEKLPPFPIKRTESLTSGDSFSITFANRGDLESRFSRPMSCKHEGFHEKEISSDDDVNGIFVPFSSRPRQNNHYNEEFDFRNSLLYSSPHAKGCLKPGLSKSDAAKTNAAIKDFGSARMPYYPEEIVTTPRSAHLKNTQGQPVTHWELPSYPSSETNRSSFMTLLSSNHCTRVERKYHDYLPGRVYATYESTTTATTESTLRPKPIYKSAVKKTTEKCYKHPKSRNKSLDDTPVRAPVNMKINYPRVLPAVTEYSGDGALSDNNDNNVSDESFGKSRRGARKYNRIEDLENVERTFHKWVRKRRESLESRASQRTPRREKRHESPSSMTSKKSDHHNKHKNERVFSPKSSGEALSERSLHRSRPRRLRRSISRSSGGESENVREEESKKRVDRKMSRRKSKRSTTKANKSNSPRKNKHLPRKSASPETSDDRIAKRRESKKSTTKANKSNSPRQNKHKSRKSASGDRVEKRQDSLKSPTQRVETNLKVKPKNLPTKRDSVDKKSWNKYVETLVAPRPMSKENNQVRNSPKKKSWNVHKDHVNTFRAASKQSWPLRNTTNTKKDRLSKKRTEDIWLDERLMNALGRTPQTFLSNTSKGDYDRSDRKEKVVAVESSDVGGGLKETKWAMTQVNIFHDGSKSYAVCRPTRKKPSVLPRKVTRVFVTVPQGKSKKSVRASS